MENNKVEYREYSSYNMLNGNALDMFGNDGWILSNVLHYNSMFHYIFYRIIS